MTTPPEELTWRGMKALDRDGNQIGTVQDIYLDRETGAPDWATLKTGLLGTHSTFVPLADATASHADGELRLPYTKAQIKDAPGIDNDGELSPEEEQELRRHYRAGG